MGAIVETGKNFKLLEEEFKRFKSLQTSQKQRGLNDFNVFTTLLSKSDEVRLHSRFISSLLDVNGLHYQGTLFLDLFLQCFKPEGFEFDSSNSHCFREYRNIGLYLTDGTYHIIIENKIYAGDQAKQVERYIETIVKENPGVEENQIWFCYLSIDRQRPSRNSLGVFDLNATKSLLVSNKITTLYSNVHYQTDIPVWLEHCMREVSNLKDLSFSIEQYQSVVAKLNRTYKSKVMNYTFVWGQVYHEWFGNQITTGMTSYGVITCFKIVENVISIFVRGDGMVMFDEVEGCSFDRKAGINVGYSSGDIGFSRKGLC